MHVLIFAGGSVQPGSRVNAALAQADLIIAADSGAATALDYGYRPAIVVGDFDSLAAPLVQQLQLDGCQFIRHPVEKDETDTELALEIAISHGATRITLLGALGGTRFDHMLANIFLLLAYPHLPVRIIDGSACCWLLTGPDQNTITGAVGDILSLLPIAGSASGVRTEGLYYPLHEETLAGGRPRGVSNVLIQENALVYCTQGQLLLIHTEQRKNIS
ncbi:thiamine diphosphokinase [Tengunoibacter tsumagoiensis]|uniref:Thiamine diphosphokinase n=1 Tax=Tengunoibacter tsumagoiensis TaxID=2014871 RepID=A0A402AA54_9CHLR|nr:thiamine diphosphokinase [Tengunoibacter tsumagoiensis]GCE16052.1 thiamine pyrophosphokinase [Tengunoibacter tsumagoiensis]